MDIYVGNLPWSVDDAGLTAMFAPHGTVQRARVVTDRDSGRSRGFGFVTMGAANEAQAAIQALNGADCSGRALTVRAAEDRQSGGGGGGGGGYRQRNDRGGGGGGGGGWRR